MERIRRHLPELAAWALGILLVPVAGSTLIRPGVPGLEALTAALGGACVLGIPLCIVWHRAEVRRRAAVEAEEVARHEADRRTRELRASRESTDHARAALRRLRAQVDLLSAIREVTLVANDHTDPDRILTEVLRIAEGLLGSDRLSIFLLRDRRSDGSGGGDRPLVRAVRKEGETHTDGPVLAAAETDRAIPDRAWLSRRTVQEHSDGVLEVATPLYADLDPRGVFHARLDGVGFDSRRVLQAERQLESLAKHLALALEKPRLYDRAVVDGLTRLYTKRHFVHQLDGHVGKARRLGTPLALILCDIDHFKRVNDTHGHLSGDRVLREVAGVLRTSIRDYDAAFRYGGEEMAVVAPDASAEEARTMAERIRARIADLAVASEEGRPIPVTASFGVAEFRPAMSDQDDLVGEADEALYHAKETGRDRVVVAGEMPTPKKGAVPGTEGSRSGAGSTCLTVGSSLLA